jgi:AbiV family abortive infection protein
MIPSKKTLSRIKEEVYINAVRLFCDACTLYKVHAYPSSYAFAILSFEELGKLEMIDHICDDIIINPDSNPQEFLDHLFSREMLFSHTNKQIWASDPILKGITKRIEQIANRELEKNKQDALYVGYANRRIRSPKRISAIKAYTELTNTFDKFKDTADIGFNGFDCFSDAQSRAKSKRYLKKIGDLFMKLNKPGKKKT